jgi:hypothetical protein
MYREERKLGWAYLLLVGVVVTVVVCGVALVAYVKEKGMAGPVDWLVAASMVLPIVMVLWAFWACREYRVQLDDWWLRFGFRGWSATLPVEELVSARSQESSLWRTGGLGCRYDLRGRVVYMAGSGPAVEVTTRRGRRYLFSCSDPERLLGELERIGVQVDWQGGEQASGSG